MGRALLFHTTRDWVEVLDENEKTIYSAKTSKFISRIQKLFKGLKMSKHWKTIEFEKAGSTYELEIDAEDPENLVLETVTHIDGPKPEEDIDPLKFEDSLDDDDWIQIENLLKETR